MFQPASNAVPAAWDYLLYNMQLGLLDPFNYLTDETF